MPANILATTIFDETIQSDVHIEIEWEFDAQPNGKPDPMDSYSEGYDILPEVLDINIVEIVDEMYEEGDEFMILFDDCNRASEQHTFDDLLHVMETKGIKHYFSKDFDGLKNVCPCRVPLLSSNWDNTARS